MTVPLIVDVDTGIDDSLALLYLLASADARFSVWRPPRATCR